MSIHDAETIHNHPYDEIRVGQTAELQRTLTRDDITLFSKVSGDLSPAHLDQAYAERSAAGELTAHSLWSNGLVSSLLGNVLPGVGTVLHKQNLEFYRPVGIDDVVTARIKVREKLADNHVIFECDVVNEDGEAILSGMAEVVAPSEKITLPKPALPAVTVRYHDSYAVLLEEARRRAAVPTAVIHPCEEKALRGAMAAARDGLIEPWLVGPERRIRAIADEYGIAVDGYRMVDVPHSHAAADRGVQLVHEGAVEILMKGSLHTGEVISAVLNSTSGLRTERRLSHVFAMDVPTYPKALFITDAAVNIAPDLEAMRWICQNAIDFAKALGVEVPRVALLSAVEYINPKIPSTIEAAALCKMADRGQITGGLLDGPLAMDNAIDLEAAQTKGITSPVAGQADVLVAPDLESGNILAKQLTFLTRADAAGILLGARVPVIMTSRADTVRGRLASAATAVLYAHALREKTAGGLAP